MKFEVVTPSCLGVGAEEAEEKLLEVAGRMRRLSSCLEEVDDAAAARDEGYRCREGVGHVCDDVDGVVKLVASTTTGTCGCKAGKQKTA